MRGSDDTRIESRRHITLNPNPNHRGRQVPPGHTRYSWVSVSPRGCGHTDFSWVGLKDEQIAAMVCDELDLGVGQRQIGEDWEWVDGTRHDTQC